MTPLVSIILPVYNVQAHFGACLDSLAAITYPNTEYSLVDDASTDGCGEMCDAFAKTHERVTVMHFPSNKGVSYARAQGLELAQGAFVLFVDADDAVHPEIVSRLVGAALEQRADIVSCQRLDIWGDKARENHSSMRGRFAKEDIMLRVKTDLLHNFSFGAPSMPLYVTGKLFRRDKVASSIQAALGLRYGEDTLATMDYLIRHADVLFCQNEPLYYYHHHSEQITASPLPRIWPLFLPYWERMDALGGHLYFRQLVPRIWSRIKPSIYDRPENWGGILKGNQFVQMNRVFRNSPVMKKYIWDNPEFPRNFRRKPHWFLLKHRLFWTDYFLYFLCWLCVR